MVCSFVRCQQRDLRNEMWVGSPYPWIDTASLRCHADCRWWNENQRSIAVAARFWCVAVGDGPE